MVFRSIIRYISALAAALALVSCTPKPKDYLEALDRGMEAQNKGDLKRAYANYLAAYEIADKVGNGARAVNAAWLGANTAAAIGKTDDAMKLLETALRDYRIEAPASDGRYMRNDLAVYKARQKKYGEAAQLLKEELKRYQDKEGSFSPAFPFVPFSVMVRNLARVLAADQWTADTETWYDDLTTRIIDNATLNSKSAHLWMGSGAALRALAALAKSGPRAAEAASLEEKAAEFEADESRVPAIVGERERCHTRELKAVKQTVCMLELP